MSALGPITEISPGAQYVSDEELEKALREVASPLAHPCCTTAMMKRDLGGVVGPDLKVYGTVGLRVVDASVFPMLPGAHLSGTVYAVAERAADLVKEEWRGKGYD